MIGQASPRSSKDIVGQFVKLDVEGKRLSPEGWERADSLFAAQSPRPESKGVVVIAWDYAISQTGKPQEDRDIYFGYEELGTLDLLTLRFVPTIVTEQTKSYLEYQLVEGAKSGGLLIAGRQPTEMHVTVPAALELLRNESKRPLSEPMKRNVAISIRSLEKYPRK